MEQLSAALTVLLEAWSRQLLGPVADRIVVGTLDWAAVATALAVLLATLLVNAALVAVVRRQARAAPGGANGAPLRPDLFAACGRPLYALSWLGGLYLAATPLLAAVPPSAGLEFVLRASAGLFDIGVFAVVTWVFVRFTRVLDARLGQWASRSAGKYDDLAMSMIGRSLRVLMPVLGIIFGLPLLHLAPEYSDAVGKATSALLIIAIAVVLLQAIRVSQRVVLARFDTPSVDGQKLRKVTTQVHVIGRVLDVIVVLFAVASVLMLFPQVRHVGASLLASAGIVGIIAGIAAQKTTANLLAGFQIALAQPMREGDYVIVENEWGQVDEITLTYVVVRIWDQRRLVVPLGYFIDKPFQNWTRGSPELVGSVYVWVDYSFPVDEARHAVQQIVEASTLWDRRFWNMQVADANERAMQLRILATAANAPTSWDLRCEIREKFIAYIQTRHPGSLPLVRAALGDGAAG